MLINREVRKYSGAVRVWVGKYKNLTNLTHWHSDNELVFAEKGNAMVYLDGKTFHLDEGKCIFIAPNSIHSIKAENGSILSFFLFDKEISIKIAGNMVLKCPILRENYNFQELYRLIDKEFTAASPLSALSVNNRIERLMIDIFTNEDVTEVILHDDYLLERYKRLLLDINERYSVYTIEDAAKFTALSESYFSKFFKKMADMTFTQYLNLVRVEKAIEMIRAKTTTMTSVAISCGFGTIRNFNRVFKAITGYSPRELPNTYDTVSMHPTYGIESTFDPTSADSELI
jgi:xylan 1,4-beta-xylosidase